ncbi:hypothetical protein Egran_00213 [Elaphomyces granulatus]|uniref:Uncharacterized protein n=1 Tax=Elaphomyces granulatus TaxID=519963 RepID=A0A232M6K9_9EURO|nr:hypothetical protein Egran_00213 [Elaphomyces granulatus]
MDRFIRPHRQNTRPQGFWKVANGGSRSRRTRRSESKSGSAAGNPFLEPPKPKKQRKETSWVYAHFKQTTPEGKTFFDKQTGKTKEDTQYSCLYCTGPEEWTTSKALTRGSTSNLQKHLGQKHGVYKDQDIPTDIRVQYSPMLPLDLYNLRKNSSIEISSTGLLEQCNLSHYLIILFFGRSGMIFQEIWIFECVFPPC